MLATAVGNLNKVQTILPVIQDLGRRHAGYGVTDAHYEPVGDALLWTLEQGLGEQFTPAVKEAWTATYLMVAAAMKDAAASIRQAAE
jgi:hemoglobin-like flavoprotein